MNKLVVLGCTILALVAQTAGAQRSTSSQPKYRDGQPEVLRPEPPPPEPQGFDPDRLRAALRAAKGPRFVLMWNKALSDNVMTSTSPLPRPRKWRR